MFKHGLCDTPEYSVWERMRSRCRYKKDISYKNYGRRGIKICKRWDDFNKFLLDMGKRPDSSYSIERVNNDGNYRPDNCIWATRVQQNNNRRMNSNNTSGYRGVARKRQNEWVAQVNYKHKAYCLGHFNTPLDAAIARDKFIIDNGFPHKLNNIDTGVTA